MVTKRNPSKFNTKMTELDENLRIIQEQVEEAEESNYEDMSMTEIMMLYQQFTNLLWMKLNQIIANGKKE